VAFKNVPVAGQYITHIQGVTYRIIGATPGQHRENKLYAYLAATLYGSCSELPESIHEVKIDLAGIEDYQLERLTWRL